MHLTEEEIEKLLANRLQPVDQNRVVRHLLAGCGLCSRQVVEQTPGLLLEKAAEDRSRKATPSAPREKALLAAVDQEERWRTDERKLARSLELLRTTPRDSADLELQQAKSLRGIPLAEALLQRSFALRFSNPQSTKWLAYNAVKAAESLAAPGRDPWKVLDLQALAWAHLANAFRITEEFGEAELAFDKSRRLLRQGSGDLELLASIATFEGDLRTSQRRLSIAEKLYDRAYRLYLQTENLHLAGRTLLIKSLVEVYGGKPRTAVHMVQKSLLLIDPQRDEKLTAIARQGLIFTLIDVGEYTRAGKLLMRSGLRKLFADDPLALLKLRQTEGNLMAGIGKVSTAVRIHQEVLMGFVDQNKSYNAAMVGLSLLPLLVREGKLQKMRFLAKEVYGMFRDLGITEEAVKAQRYLR